MERAYLIAETDPTGAKRVPIGAGIVIGRSADCSYVIDDAAASRRHVQVVRKGEKYTWKDLGSTNGTLLNGAKMLEGFLAPGDRLQIGDSVFRFEMETHPDEADLEDSTLFKPTIIDMTGSVVTRAPSASNAERLLQALYQVVNDIASEFDPPKLVDRVLENTANALDAQRCTLVVADGPDTELRPCPGCTSFHVYQDGQLQLVDSDQIKVSRTVINRVLQDGESVFFQDTSEDSELNAAQSIMSLNLRSIICVPLRGKGGIIGLLYLDTNRPGQVYTEEDLLLSTAIGNSAGLALENAVLQQEMLDKQRIEQEIEVAWTIQEGFLVKDWPPSGGRFEVYGKMRPAKTVGGDFYDFIELPGNRACILIGDVSGKGVPASLTMAKLLAEFRVCAKESAEPTEVIARLNESLVRHSKRGMFCTLHYLVVELDNARVISVNAGHHPTIIVSPSGVRNFGDASGPPIGVLDYATWEPRETVLESGETLLLYTDGIVEARPDATEQDTQVPQSEAPEDYGEKRLMDLLQQQGDRSPQALVESVIADLDRFCGSSPPHDDCTQIAIRYLS